MFLTLGIYNYESESVSCLVISDSLQLHGLLQARILEWATIPFSGDLSDPGIEPGSPVLQTDSLPPELPRKPITIVTFFFKSSDFPLFSKIITME